MKTLDPNSLRGAPEATRSAAARPTQDDRAAETGPDLLMRLQGQIGNQQVGMLLRKAEGDPPRVDEAAAIEADIQRLRGSGTQLHADLRQRMEHAMGADFSRVNVHTGTEADALSARLGARAFTTGPDIFFKQGEYDPGSSTGRELLAHELTHVVQNGSGPRAKLTVTQPGDEAEREADAVARAVVEGERTGAAARPGVDVQAPDPSGLFGSWQDAWEGLAGLLGIPVALPAKPFTGDVGNAPPVQTVKGSANSEYAIVYDGKDSAGPAEFWPHGPPGPTLGKTVEVERGRSGVVRMRFVTWWHTEGGGPYADGTADATIEAHFTCDDDGNIVVEAPTVPAASGGGAIVTPIAQGAAVGPRLSATAGVEHAMTSTQSAGRQQDRSSGQSNSGGNERSASGKAEGSIKVVDVGIDIGAKQNYSQGNDRKEGEQRTSSTSLQQAGMERIAFTREVTLVAKPRKPLAAGSMDHFDVNQARVPRSGVNTLVRWWADLDPDLQNGVRNGSVGLRFSGHADDTGDAMHNLELSGRRAAAVQQVFEQVVGKTIVTRIEKLGNAMPEGEKKSNPHERRVDFELFRIKK